MGDRANIGVQFEAEAGENPAKQLKAFETWVHAGVRYLAIPGDRGSVRVVDEAGNNYGAWYTVERFRSRVPTPEPLGRCFLDLRFPM